MNKNFFKNKKIILSISIIVIAICFILYGLLPIIYKNRLPILCYHCVNYDSTSDNSYLYVTPEKLEHQMDLLLENGYTPISYYDLMDHFTNKTKLPEKPIIITFDDGYYDNYLYAYPIFKEKNIKATIFVTTAIMGNKTDDGRTDKYEKMLSWEECKEMEESGLINIESHTNDHLNLKTVSYDEVLNQLTVSKKMIDDNLNKDSKVIAYPYGAGDKKINKNAVKAGYSAINYVNPSYTNALLKNDMTKLHRIEVDDSTTDEEFLELISENKEFSKKCSLLFGTIIK